MVARGVVSARLAEAHELRAADLAELDGLLASRPAGEAAARVGADSKRLRAALASLSDDELRDLARRARQLQGDPAAGLDKDIHDLLILFLIVALVILVIQAVD
jgi:Flp pilus assembly protein TadB